jgi:hypothetical protein
MPVDLRRRGDRRVVKALFCDLELNRTVPLVLESCRQISDMTADRDDLSSILLRIK